MELAELFRYAVVSLPEAARRRMDGDVPLDWNALEDPGTSVPIAETVETLAARLIREVGIFPADVASGRERQCSANAWHRQVAVEPDGERYRLRNRRTGEVHGSIRPEALAGYVLLALQLVTLVHQATESWITAGDRYPSASDDGPAPLASCAIRIGARLKWFAVPDRSTTGNLACVLEDAWNAQHPELREELATVIQPIMVPGAYAPRQRHYAPSDSYRLETFNPGELRWLCALGQRALDEAPPDELGNALQRFGPQSDSVAPGISANDLPSDSEDTSALDEAGAASAALQSDSDGLALGRELAELQCVADRLSGPAPGARLVFGSDDDVATLEMTALEAQVEAETGTSLNLGSRPDGAGADEVLAALRRAVARLPTPIRRRLGDVHGIGVAHALARFQDSGEADAAIAELRVAIAARQAPAWLEELGSSLLADAGGHTRDGVRTGSLSLDFAHGPEGCLATEAESGFQGYLTLPGLVEQLHLALVFAEHAWNAVEMLQTAGTEAAWTLGETLDGTSRLGATEREMLEAARQIEHALGRSRHAFPHPDRLPSALEQATIAAEAIGTVGPAVRATAGWPGGAQAPDPCNSEDVARIVDFAKILQKSVKLISDRQIAGGISAGRGA